LPVTIAQKEYSIVVFLLAIKSNIYPLLFKNDLCAAMLSAQKNLSAAYEKILFKCERCFNANTFRIPSFSFIPKHQ